jgi:hypothetical protein
MWHSNCLIDKLIVADSNR